MAFPTKDPSDVDWRYFVWCDKDATNDGSASDDGELQGETITAVAFTISPSGELTEDTSNTDAVTIGGTSYAVNTVAAIRLSAGTSGKWYTVTCQITTSAGRTLERSENQPVENR